MFSITEVIVFIILVLIVLFLLNLVYYYLNKKNSEQIRTEFLDLQRNDPHYEEKAGQILRDIYHTHEGEDRALTAEELYMAGDLHTNMGNMGVAVNVMNDAINEFNRENVANNLRYFINDRLDDWANRELVVNDLHGIIIPIDPKPREEKVRELKTNKNMETDEKIDNLKDWVSDGQNVHDSAIVSDVKEQYDKLIRYNVKYPNLGRDLSYEDAKKQLLDMDYGIYSALERIEKNYAIPSILSTEKELFMNVWYRINSPDNAANKDELKQSLISQLRDFTSNDNIVCQDGRVTRLMSTFTKLDADDDLGILKNKEIIRNEIFHEASQVVKKVLDKLPEEVKNDYDEDNQTAEVENAILTMKDGINELMEKHSENSKLTPEQLGVIKQECLSVI